MARAFRKFSGNRVENRLKGRNVRNQLSGNTATAKQNEARPEPKGANEDRNQ